MFDYTDVPDDLIPDGTVVTVQMRVNAGNVGEDGMLTRSKDGTCQMLDCELVVLEGPYARRKFRENILLVGTTDKQQGRADRNKGRIKLMLDSAFNLDPEDKSPQARAQRTVSLKIFDGLNFIAKVGIEPEKPKNNGTNEKWAARNNLAGIITRNDKEWGGAVQQQPSFNGGGAPAATTTPAAPISTSASPISKSSWAS